MKKLVLSLFILCTLTVSVFAQERTVTGKVTSSEDGLPIPGASVKVKEAPAVSVATGADGKFSFKVPANAKTLTISYLGYSTTSVAIPSSNVVNASLDVDAKTLDQVVITAGGVSITKRQQGNQSTMIKASELVQAKAFNVASALTGKVAGLQVNAVSSGVNPQIRLVLRGNRSLLGNNQALVVVDNVIVPSNILGNLNPEDIENIEVLNGAGGAAIFGSDASNGALVITTKKGTKGKSVINASQTTQIEQVSFLPQLQQRFGSGTGSDDVKTYTPYENQQYGPAFDGSMRPIGKRRADGSIQTVAYSPVNDKSNFWENGLANQSDLSVSSGDEKGSYYFSAQYFDQKSTVPNDFYNRFSMRINGTRDLGNNITFDFNANYVQNRFDRPSSIAAAFDQVLQTPSQIPLLRYKNYKTDDYATPDEYFNEYYPNPYFTLGNNRSLTRNDYLTGNATLKWFPIKKLSVLIRANLSTRNFSSKSTSDKFTYSDYRKSITPNFNDLVGGVSDGSGFATQLNPEFQVQFKDKLSKNFSLNLLVGGSVRDNNSKNVSIGTQGGLALPGFFNNSNGLQNPSAGEGSARERQMGLFADARIGFKDYLYLHVSGRNDWRSILAANNRSFFYPAADLSFIATDAISFLKSSKVINVLKLRGGVSQVGQVSLGPYALLPIFGQAYGYPYNGIPGFTQGNQIVAPGINPEITLSFEGGVDFELLKSRITGSFTMYKSNTTDQTVGVNITPSTGFTSYLTNTGEVSGEGIETSIRVIPVKNLNNGLEISIGANYTYNNNRVVSISQDLPRVGLSGTTALGVFAEEGQPFPIIRGTDYNRDPQGRIIVDRLTGMPSVTTSVQNLGNTEARHRLGLDASIDFKGFRLTGLFEYRGGFVMAQNSGNYDFSGSGIRTTYFNRERFVVPNSSYLDATTGAYVANTNITTRSGGVDFWTEGPTNTGVATNYVYSAAFWKLRELALSYDVPKSFLGNVKYIKGARISLQGRNLFLWTPKTNLYSDPEYSAAGSDNNGVGITGLGQSPPSRFYGATLTLTF